MRRRPAIAAAGVAVVAWSACRARSRDVSPAEARVFRAFNDASDLVLPAAWSVMQLGSLGSVFARSVAIGQRGDRGEAVRVAVIGTALWGGVKLVKPLVGRGRPAAHLPDVHVRGAPQSGLGYPSGHAAVSLALALLGTTKPVWRPVDLTGAAATAAARMYVGAHLPLDIVGGASLGFVVGSLARPVASRT